MFREATNLKKRKKDNTMNTIVLSTFAVRNSDGSVDSDATVSKFQDALSSFIAERDTETETIGTAVAAVLDSLNGTRGNMDYLVSATCRELNADHAAFKVLGDKIRAYVRDNASDKNEDGTPEDPTKLFHIGRGKGGGVGRWTDILAAKK
jgi:hypothetical protein